MNKEKLIQKMREAEMPYGVKVPFVAIDILAEAALTLLNDEWVKLTEALGNEVLGGDCTGWYDDVNNDGDLVWVNNTPANRKAKWQAYCKKRGITI